MHVNIENKEDGKAGYGYVETDPTGRYGRVSSIVSTLVFLYLFLFFSICFAVIMLFDLGLYLPLQEEEKFWVDTNDRSSMIYDMIVFCVYICFREG